MTFIDWFAGIGGFRLGLERAGMKCVGSCEIDKSARKKYEKRFGEAPTFRDINEVDLGDVPAADLWCGGFPCQGLSVAGKRGGLDDPRSGLWWQWLSLVEKCRPRWLLIENVPGFLSCSKGADFGLALASLDKLDYGVSGRILNAQHFGVPQRRRRFYIVGYLGNPCPPEILFEPESGGRNPPPRGKTGTDIAHSLDGCTGGPSGKENQQTFIANPIRPNMWDNSDARYQAGSLVTGTLRSNMRNNSNPATEAGALVTQTLRCTDPKQGGPSDTVPIVHCFENHGQDSRIREIDKPTIHAKWGTGGNNAALIGQAADADGMRAAAGVPRRMDVHVPGTALGGCACADSPRYPALGNAVAVPVVEWIGKRIMRHRIEMKGAMTYE